MPHPKDTQEQKNINPEETNNEKKEGEVDTSDNNK